MSKVILATALVANALLGVTLAASQEATEVFIPIGQSPGVSKRQSVMGTVDSVDEKGRSLQIATPSGPVTVVVAEKTRIFRDQSQLKLRNEVGTFADIRKGRTVEVKLVPGEGKRTAEWIKVQITEAGR